MEHAEFDAAFKAMPEGYAEGYASGDVTLNRAWIPPLYLTWD